MKDFEGLVKYIFFTISQLIVTECPYRDNSGDFSQFNLYRYQHEKSKQNVLTRVQYCMRLQAGKL